MKIRKRFFVMLYNILFGHILNWGTRLQRREKREKVKGYILYNFFKKYLPKKNEVKIEKIINNDKKEKIWSLWLQGEDNAPDLVKTCFKRIRKFCNQELLVLDENNLHEYISLPKYILDKRKKGKIKNAHFADIVRVELLYKYGGFWMDATLFLTEKIHNYIVKEDFFVFLAGSIGGGSKYSFMQNCFIRSRKGAYLLSAWRNMILKYWKNNNSEADYFMHQILFKTLVLNDEIAKNYFEKMPHIIQDPTHLVWWDYKNKPFDNKKFKELTKDAFFQKITYMKDKPIKNSFADKMIYGEI